MLVQSKQTLTISDHLNALCTGLVFTCIPAVHGLCMCSCLICLCGNALCMHAIIHHLTSDSVFADRELLNVTLEQAVSFSVSIL